MLCKCSGKYIDIYFILEITYYYNNSNNDDDDDNNNNNNDVLTVASLLDRPSHPTPIAKEVGVVS